MEPEYRQKPLDNTTCGCYVTTTHTVLKKSDSQTAIAYSSTAQLLQQTGNHYDTPPLSPLQGNK
jgi:hypothetical protein